MAIREIRYPIRDMIPVQTALISVFDKSRLFREGGVEGLVDGLLIINPNILILSTGGTATKIEEYLGSLAKTNLARVEDYTGVLEMEGGLVKTLVPMLHAGILGERENPAHQIYLAQDMNGGRYIDLLVSNFYPFQKVTAEPGCTIEHARGNIDIGGPSMARGAAKNFHGAVQY